MTSDDNNHGLWEMVQGKNQRTDYAPIMNSVARKTLPDYEYFLKG